MDNLFVDIALKTLYYDQDVQEMTVVEHKLMILSLKNVKENCQKIKEYEYYFVAAPSIQKQVSILKWMPNSMKIKAMQSVGSGKQVAGQTQITTLR